MAKHTCIHCRTIIIGGGTADPYICGNCEALVKKAELNERFVYLRE
ncbi:MAG TPA: hypothetical protein VJJ52_06250 [Candidatus Nanoarchaeia archaeon]|nr:hypothetical protein [Candidatus Nanoarchaeia archaeon]